MKDKILKAYEDMFGNKYSVQKPLVDEKLLKEFPDITILKFARDRLHQANIFATNGMSEVSCQDSNLPEVFMFSYAADDLPVKALSVFMEHAAEEEIEPGRVFSGFSDDSSSCSSILVTFPLPDGAGFPEMYDSKGREIYFLWLLPITEKEKLFIEKEGLDTFEDLLLEKDPLYYGWDRKSIV